MNILLLFKQFIAIILIFFITPLSMAMDSNEEKGPYDPDANAHMQIKQAIEKAQKNDQHILLVFGANWCPWCRALHNLMENNKELNSFLNDHYQQVLIDVGRKDNNMDINEKYGNPVSLGLPALVVLDENGKQLVVQETASLETKNTEEKGHDVSKVLDFLEKWQYPIGEK